MKANTTDDGAIRQVIEAHPKWGYRRVTAWVRRTTRKAINSKRVRRVMQETK